MWSIFRICSISTAEQFKLRNLPIRQYLFCQKLEFKGLCSRKKIEQAVARAKKIGYREVIAIALAVSGLRCFEAQKERFHGANKACLECKRGSFDGQKRLV